MPSLPSPPPGETAPKRATPLDHGVLRPVVLWARNGRSEGKVAQPQRARVDEPPLSQWHVAFIEPASLVGFRSSIPSETRACLDDHAPPQRAGRMQR